ncbi:MAG: hypothetical protein ACQ9IQ_13800, partial [Nitrospirales bacterium]
KRFTAQLGIYVKNKVPRMKLLASKMGKRSMWQGTLKKGKKHSILLNTQDQYLSLVRALSN